MKHPVIFSPRRGDLPLLRAFKRVACPVADESWVRERTASGGMIAMTWATDRGEEFALPKVSGEWEGRLFSLSAKIDSDLLHLFDPTESDPPEADLAGFVLFPAELSPRRATLFSTLNRNDLALEFGSALQAGWSLWNHPLVHFREIPGEVPPDLFIDPDPLYLLFSSPRGVEFFMEKWRRLGTKRSLPACLAAGEQTAFRLRRLGCTVLKTSAEGGLAGLLPFLEEFASPARVLHAAPREGIPLEVRNPRVRVIRFPVYETLADKLIFPLDRVPVQEIFEGILFSSPSSVDSFMKKWPFPVAPAAIPIGATTREALEKWGLRVLFLPEKASLASVARRLAETVP